jgi:hypothetical protein
MKGFICTESSGGQYVDMNGVVKFARSNAPFFDADPKQMLRKSKDEKGNDVVTARYGFQQFDGAPVGTSAAATARGLKKMANENAAYKEENDALRVRIEALEADKPPTGSPPDEK